MSNLRFYSAVGQNSKNKEFCEHTFLTFVKS
jgi:hypothetical protein